MANTFFIYAQENSSLNAILTNIRNQKFDVAEIATKKSVFSDDEKKQLLLYNQIKNEFGVFKSKPTVEFIAKEKSKSKFAQSLNYLNLGLFQLLYKFDKESDALKNLNQALKNAESIRSKPLNCEIYKAIFYYYFNLINIENKQYEVYLNEYRENLYDDFEELNFKSTKLTLALFSDSKKFSSVDITELKSLCLTEKDDFLRGQINKSLGLYYDINEKEYGQASFYYKNAKIAFSKRHNGESIIGQNSCQICTAVTEFYLKKYDNAIHNLNTIDTSYTGKNYGYNKIFKYVWLSNCYQKTGNYDHAFFCLKKETFLKNQFEQSKHDAINSELTVKYGTLILQTKNKEKMLWIYFCLGLIAVGAIIAYLKVKNLKKKEQIAIKEKELQNERFEKTLKDHELDSIESMLEGQEKERIKIANDLHDNLGSMLVTLKLNFQNLKERRDTLKTEEDRLYEKTDALLEEAYQKVRTIAHTKNAGVIANEGLVPAIKNIADKVSVPGILEVEVISFGLENRLESTLEVSIFRMIQEILTNIIKHSGANKATIHLTQHDDSLNIIVEDNGKGFDASVNNPNAGMGLSNIKKKVQHMNGDFTIDSFEGKGTTIIIDIPI
jgi:signal transduction histidine kinase